MTFHRTSPKIPDPRRCCEKTSVPRASTVEEANTVSAEPTSRGGNRLLRLRPIALSLPPGQGGAPIRRRSIGSGLLPSHQVFDYDELAGSCTHLSGQCGSWQRPPFGSALMCPPRRSGTASHPAKGQVGRSCSCCRSAVTGFARHLDLPSPPREGLMRADRIRRDAVAPRHPGPNVSLNSPTPKGTPM